jgi:hypothetical protein
MRAQIKEYHGMPTLFIDGQPTFASYLWSSPPRPDGYPAAAMARWYAAAGIHLYAFDVGTQGRPPEWCGPRPGQVGHIDFSTVGDRLGQIIAVDPQACFHLRIHLEMPKWWCELYPEECEVDSNGKRLTQSFASLVWRQQANDFLRAYVAHLQEIGMADRVIAYQTGAGGTGEWVKQASSMQAPCGDYSEPMRRHFRKWLYQRYSGDLEALRAAWGDTGVTFETAEVPPAEQQFGPRYETFRDPGRDGNVIDYYRCLADLSAELVIEFNRTVKEATNGQALTGAFYGYWLSAGSNSCFHREGGKTPDVSMVQRSGHLGFAKVLAAPEVDFIASPYHYGFRAIGGEGAPIPATESARLHGKLYIYEDDTRTHLRAGEINYGCLRSAAESEAVLRRNLAQVLTRGLGIWWAGSSPESPHIDPDKEPAFRKLLQQFQQLVTFSLQLDRSGCAEIAVLIDDEGFLYENIYNSLDMPLVYQQRVWGLPRLGAPADYYILQDMIQGRVPPHKLYIFLNPFRLDNQRRAALAQQLRRDGRVALWIYAPGYLNEDAALEHMTDLTGFRFGKGEQPWVVRMNISNFCHPITQNLPQDLYWGTNSILSPIFHLEDPEAETLGQIVYSQGRCLPGIGVKAFRDWTSVYVGVPDIPSPVLRGIARFAGVHLYSEDGDVLYATRQLLGIHTIGGGQRDLKLPGRVQVVYDLFEGRVIARDADHFQVHLQPASTALYYTGDAALLENL